MRFQELRPDEMPQFAENVRNLLAGTELSAIDPVVRAQLLTMIGTLPEVLAGQVEETFVKKAEFKASLTGRNSTNDVTGDVMKIVRDYLIAGNAPKEQFDKCAFVYPAKNRVRVIAETPSGLSVTGFSNNVNKGRFVGNNKTGTVTYEIFRREGKGGEWLFVKQVRKQSFTDEAVTPGQQYVYKVRAVAARNVSDFSNETIVYGG